MSPDLDLIAILKAFMVFGTAFIFTFVVIPFVIRIVRNEESQNWLSSSSIGYVKKPALGGITIFLGAIITLCFWLPFTTLPQMQYYLSGLFVILILGIKDDFEPLSPLFKLLIQFCAASILVFYGDLYLSTNDVFMGFQKISTIYMQLLSMIVIVFIINAINFLDGINALCSAVTVLISIVLGSYFFIINEMALSFIALALAGSVFAFLYYNITPARIFMGDTGSLTIGTFIAILSINFLNIELEYIEISQSPSFLFAILIIPLLDAIRVIIGRLIHFRSPFIKDKTHIHHLFLSKGFTHMQSSAILTFANIFFIILAYNLQGLNQIIVITIQVVIAFFLIGVLFFKRKKIFIKDQIQKSF